MCMSCIVNNVQAAFASERSRCPLHYMRYHRAPENTTLYTLTSNRVVYLKSRRFWKGVLFPVPLFLYELGIDRKTWMKDRCRRGYRTCSQRIRFLLTPKNGLGLTVRCEGSLRRPSSRGLASHVIARSHTTPMVRTAEPPHPVSSSRPFRLKETRLWLEPCPVQHRLCVTVVTCSFPPVNFPLFHTSQWITNYYTKTW